MGIRFLLSGNAPVMGDRIVQVFERDSGNLRFSDAGMGLRSGVMRGQEGGVPLLSSIDRRLLNSLRF